MLKEIKHRWCNFLDELEGALNQKAYDSEYFIDTHYWPEVEIDLWEPNFGYY